MNSLIQPQHLLRTVQQPIYDLQTRSVEYYETLARVIDDASGVAHGPLIQLAEQHRFIHLLDRFVLVEALRESSRHGFRFGVNLSPLSIEHSAAEILALLVEHGSAAKRLTIEITETTSINDLYGLKVFLKQAKSLGCRIALDDYGSPNGCFSERLVYELRPNFVKLDGGMLDRALDNGRIVELLRIKTLASLVGAQLIAEWVDTPRKVKLLGKLDIRYAQGLNCSI